MDAVLLRETVTVINPESTSTDNISVDIVLQNHRYLLQNGGDTDDKMKQLIELMGGMDSVLNEYLLNHRQMNEAKLHSINKIILSKNKLINQASRHCSRENFSMSVLNAVDNPVMYLSVENNLLYKMVGKQTAERLIKFMTSTWMVILTLILGISAVIGYCLWMWARNYISITMYNFLCLWSIIINALSTIWALLAFSILNITAVKGIASFSCIFKLLYFFRGFVCWSIYQSRKETADKLFIITEITMFISFLCIYTTYSFIDGFYISKRYTTIVSISGAIIFTVLTFSFTYAEAMDSSDIRYLSVIDGTSIDLVSWAASSMRVVCIFVWRQTIYTLWKPEKSTLMQKTVVLKWI